MFLEDVLSSNLRRAEQSLREHSHARAEALHLKLSVEDAVRTADLAVDFVPDELESKLEILSMMDRMAPPRTIFCTPTSLSLADLASCTYRAAQCIALEPFEDETEGELTLVRSAFTADSTVVAVHQWLTRLNLKVRIVEEQAPTQPL